VLLNVTECYIFRLYHLVTRVLISPASWPLGAPSIGKKGNAATTHQRASAGASSDRSNSALQHGRAQARTGHHTWCTNITTCADADHSRLPWSEHSRTPCGECSRTACGEHSRSACGEHSRTVTSATRRHRAQAYPDYTYNMRCVRKFAGFYRNNRRTVPMICKVDEVKTIAAQSQHEKSANNRG
jgi:hypothetical protein